MGKALEVISGRVLFSNNVIAPLIMAAGDSLTVRNAPLDSKVRLLNMWAILQTATGWVRLRSPRLHDNVQGLRFTMPVTDPQPLFPMGAAQTLVPQDTMICEIQVADAAGQFENVALLIGYDSLPGADARLCTWEDVQKRMVNIVTVENTIVTLNTGGWTGAQPLNTAFDLLKANTDYALLGYICSVQCCAVAWRGADTGNLRVGGPGGIIQRDLSAHWFKYLSLHYGLPLIPVFNSANRAGILIDIVQNQAAAAVVVDSIFAEIGPTAK
jgi:hypothetical protein